MRRFITNLSIMLTVISLGCNEPTNTQQQLKITGRRQSTIDTVTSQTITNKTMQLFQLTNSAGTKVAITNYGGRIVSLLVPDNSGNLIDVVLGYDDLNTYLQANEPYFGALIGRYGNRIAQGRFTLNAETYRLELNDGVNALHGGSEGFHRKFWEVKQVDDQRLMLFYRSTDGEGGYPGNLDVTVCYTLTTGNELKIDYAARTDKTTIINLTNHAYFNLNGAGNNTITDHLLKIVADEFTPIDANLIPTGKLAAVAGTPFDFRLFKVIGTDIDRKESQLINGHGYDHNFVLKKHTITNAVATAISKNTGIVMDVFTDQPGLQFYSGNFLTGDKRNGKGNVPYHFRSGFCLETQHFPDSPNQPSFPPTTLKPGEEYKTSTIYKFSIAKQ